MAATLSLASRTWKGPAGAPSLVVLHGLLGSSRNWQTIGKSLADSYTVHALDLRNHGESPHHPLMDYPTMAEDVLNWAEAAALPAFHLVGHSMGGKVAATLAVAQPRRLLSLTVVDIAPRAYPPRWEREFALLQRMPLASLRSRQEAEQWLEPEISDWAFRKFLLTNLERDAAGGLRWAVPLAILEAALPALFVQVPPAGQTYSGPTLWLRGARSRFVEESDFAMIRAFFPQAVLKTVADAGHNVHFDQPEVFCQLLRAHLQAAVTP